MPFQAVHDDPVDLGKLTLGELRQAIVDDLPGSLLVPPAVVVSLLQYVPEGVQTDVVFRVGGLVSMDSAQVTPDAVENTASQRLVPAGRHEERQRRLPLRHLDLEKQERVGPAIQLQLLEFSQSAAMNRAYG